MPAEGVLTAIVDRVTPADWRVLRTLRLRSLQTDPLSFGSTYDRELAYSDEEWQKWATDDSASDEMATFVAKQHGAPVGMVAAYRDDSDDVLFHVVAMWVAPEARRSGVGAELLAHVEQWIRDSGGAVVQLDVTTAAASAQRLYERAGYRPDGGRRESPHTAGLVQVSLTKRLREQA